MFTRWKKYLTGAAKLLLLVAIGIGVGCAARGWLLPHLPEPLARWIGQSAPEQASSEGGAEAGRSVAFWKSSMIPNFVSPRPGKDPMGMDLIPVYRDELGQEKMITLNHATMHNMGLRTSPVVRGTGERLLRTVGQVEFAEPLLGDVTLKIDGWIEQLKVNFVGEHVAKGQPLFTFYSPDLVAAQEEYLLRETGPEGGPQVFPAADKLRYWDVPTSELDRIKRAGKPQKAVNFVSPFEGWVIEKNAYAGMHMKAGMRFYRIADLSRVWVYVSVYEYQLPSVQVGQTARITLPYDPGQVLEGKVVYIYPNVDPKTRQVRVRIEFPNPGLRLKPGMDADVAIITNSDTTARLRVPLDAVIDTGQHKIVEGISRRAGRSFVQVKPGQFEPREVVLGDEVEGGDVQILSGLVAGENVVVTGQFLLEAERKVKEANLKMLTATDSQALPKPPQPISDHHHH